MIPPPRYDKDLHLKSNKPTVTDALSAEFFKAGGNKLVWRMRQLVFQIWLKDRKYTQRLETQFVLKKRNKDPILKKEDPTIYQLQRHKPSLYRILGSYGRIVRTTEAIRQKLISLYQCGFRPRKSIIDQIFALRPNPGVNPRKTSRHSTSFCRLQGSVFAAMSELGVLVNLVMAMQNHEHFLQLCHGRNRPLRTVYYWARDIK